MERLFRKVPVEGDFFIPFMELTEILSHEEKFLARMSEHESVADFQVGKFILVFARHLLIIEHLRWTTSSCESTRMKFSLVQ